MATEATTLRPKAASQPMVTVCTPRPSGQASRASAGSSPSIVVNGEKPSVSRIIQSGCGWTSTWSNWPRPMRRLI